jgi:hypothetical protein
VHLDLLVYHSPFFRAVLTGSFKEAEEKLVTLSDTMWITFELFVHWLYFDRLPTEADSPELLALYCDEDDESFQCKTLICLYVFCDKYDISRLKRLCLNTLFQNITDKPELPSFAYIGYAFANLGENDPLCHFLVDTFCYWSGADCWSFDDVQELPHRFLTKVLTRYTEYTHGGRDLVGSPELCNYHNHATSQERKECKKTRGEDEDEDEDEDEGD